MGIHKCIMQSELQESDRGVESLKAPAEQHKQTAAVEHDTMEVCYLVAIYTYV